MTTIAYGTKYEATKELTRVEIAKLVRADIKAAVAKGELPAAKYSVTCQSYSGGGSINIAFSEVKDPSFRLLNEERVRFDIEHEYRDYSELPIYSDRAREIMSKLDEILASYNYDGSDTQSDYWNVRFYGHSQPGWQWSSDVSKAERAAIAEAVEKEGTHLDVA